MIISDEKMKKHYDIFTKCIFKDGKINENNIQRAFEMVTSDMLREFQSAAMKVAFDSANNISHLELK
jgi:hypothetical protein